MDFGTLADDLGYSPLADECYHPPTAPGITIFGLWDFIRFWYAGGPPSRSSALPPELISPSRYLNIFRGEPAITKFDWPFTPTHSSSQKFSTSMSSVLHAVLPALQPGHE